MRMISIKNVISHDGINEGLLFIFTFCAKLQNRLLVELMHNVTNSMNSYLFCKIPSNTSILPRHYDKVPREICIRFDIRQNYVRDRAAAAAAFVEVRAVCGPNYAVSAIEIQRYHCRYVTKI